MIMAQEIQHLQISTEVLTPDSDDENIVTEDEAPVGNLVMQDHSYSKSPCVEVVTSVVHSPVKDRPPQLLSLIRDPEQLQALAAARHIEDQKYFENIGKDVGYSIPKNHNDRFEPEQISPTKTEKNDRLDLDGFTEVSLMLQSADFQLPKDLRAELDDGEHTDPYAHDDLPQEPSPPLPQASHDPNKRKRRVSLKLRENEPSPPPLQMSSKKKLKKKKRFLSVDGKKLSKEERRAAKLERKRLKKIRRKLNNHSKSVVKVKDITDDLAVIKAAKGGNNMKSGSRKSRSTLPKAKTSSELINVVDESIPPDSVERLVKELTAVENRRRGRPVKSKDNAASTSLMNRKRAASSQRSGTVGKKRSIVNKSSIASRKRETLLREKPIANKKPAPAPKQQVVTARRSTVGNRNPSKEQIKSTVEKRNASAEQRKPTVEKRKSPVEQRKPTVEKRKSSVEQRKPTVEKRKSSAGERKSLAENKKPSIEKRIPKRGSASNKERKPEPESAAPLRIAGRATRNSLSASELELQQALKASAAAAVEARKSAGRGQKRSAGSVRAPEPGSRRSLRSVGGETAIAAKPEPAPKRRKLRR